MKRLAFYRRGGVKNAPLAGLNERVAWRLSKGQATGAELAEIFGITTVMMNRMMGKLMQFNSVVHITSSDWVDLEGGGRDRTYTLIGKARRLAKPGGNPRRTPNSLRNANEETRRKNTERAARRARLMKAGLYIPELD